MNHKSIAHSGVMGAGRPCRAYALVFVLAALASALVAASGCAGATQQNAARAEGAAAIPGESAFSMSPDETAFIDDLQHRTFRYFWDLCNPQTGLAPDRAPTPSFASIAATGFALTSYPIGAEHGWVTRDQAAANGFKFAYFNSELDAVEFSISRQALIDAGWNGIDADDFRQPSDS